MSMEKRDTLTNLLSMTGMTRVFVNATYPGVAIPDEYKSNPALRLHLSYKFLTRLDLESDGVKADLSFGGHPFDVILPWGSIWAMEKFDGQAQAIWQEDMPEAVRLSYLAQQEMKRQESEWAAKREEEEKTERQVRIKKSPLKLV